MVISKYGSVTGAGCAEISNQLEYDDEVTYQSVRKLYDLARGGDQRPWFLTISFSHPHDPCVARKKYLDMYEYCDYPLPPIPPIPYKPQDAHSKHTFDANDFLSYEINQEMVWRSRRVYFANISYLDEKLEKF